MADNANALYQEIGLPLVSRSEHEVFTQSLQSLAAPEILYESIMAEAVDFSEDTLLNTVHFTSNIKFSNNFFIAKANSTLTAKITERELSIDQITMANYRVKVMNHLTNNVPWFTKTSIQPQRKKFTMKKTDFHLELIKSFTEGMNLPLDSIAAKLENLLTNINNIISSQTKPGGENLMFFISITYYQVHDVEKRWQPYTRTIYFRVGESLSKYIKEKTKTSSDAKLDIDIEYLQIDSQFNDEIFDRYGKAAIQYALEAGVNDLVSGCTTYDIPVDL